jgi:hypothetical protein
VGYICAADLARNLGVSVSYVHRIAKLGDWRTESPGRRRGRQPIRYAVADVDVPMVTGLLQRAA